MWLGGSLGSGLWRQYHEGWGYSSLSRSSLSKADLGLQFNIIQTDRFQLGLYARAKHINFGDTPYPEYRNAWAQTYGLNMTVKFLPRIRHSHSYYHSHVYLAPKIINVLARGAAHVVPNVIRAVVKAAR